MNKLKSVINIYNKIANKYADLFDKDLSDNQYFDKFLSKIFTGKKILDLGCGTGRASAYYVSKGFDVIGIDLSKKMLEIAKTNHPDIDFILGDIRDINFKNTFDGVSMAYSLFHLEKNDIPSVIKKAAKALNNNGVAMFILQEGQGEVFVDSPLLPGKKLFINLFTEEEVKNLLSLDFEILSVDRKKPHLKGEHPFNKLIVIARKK